MFNGCKHQILGLESIRVYSVGVRNLNRYRTFQRNG